MNALCLSALALVLAVPSSQAQTPSTGVPVTSQTPVTPNGTATASPTTGAPATPLTKNELKEQRNQQKIQERAAKDNAKAAKANAKAIKAQNKATNAAEQTQPH